MKPGAFCLRAVGVAVVLGRKTEPLPLGAPNSLRNECVVGLHTSTIGPAVQLVERIDDFLSIDLEVYHGIAERLLGH